MYIIVTFSAASIIYHTFLTTQTILTTLSFIGQYCDSVSDRRWLRKRIDTVFFWLNSIDTEFFNISRSMYSCYFELKWLSIDSLENKVWRWWKTFNFFRVDLLLLIWLTALFCLFLFFTVSWFYCICWFKSVLQSCKDLIIAA